MRYILLVLLSMPTISGVSQQKHVVNPLDQVGDTVTIVGRIIAGSWLIHVTTKPTFLNLWDSVPNHRLMIRIEPEDRSNFSMAPESYFLNKTVSVTGVVQNYKGSALIRVSGPEMIKTVEEVKKDTIAFGNKVVRNQYSTPQLNAMQGDTVLQSNWVNGITSRTFEQSGGNLKIVQKQIPLRVSPTKESPVIAELQAGIIVAILSTSRKWSYLSVRNSDGTSTIYGFIKNREVKKYLSKE